MTLEDTNSFYWKFYKSVYKVLQFLLQMGLWIFGLAPAKAFGRLKIYQIFLLLWCCEIIWNTYLAIIYDIFGDEHSLNGFVSGLLYGTHILGHLTVLIESWLIFPIRQSLWQQFQELQKSLTLKLKNPLYAYYITRRLCYLMAGELLLLICGHGVIMFTTFKTTSTAGLLYWRSLPSYLALQFKTLEFLTGLVQLNHHIIVIRQDINGFGERNLKRVFKNQLNFFKKEPIILVRSAQQDENDEYQLKLLKKFYNEVYGLFKKFNDAYSLSLLASTTVYFVDFVCNTYWILLAVLSQARDYFGLLQNASFALMAFILLSFLCWFSEEATYESRYIGCLIAKLFKPLGNKSYNDLVNEFSIQTLHQRFIITAKEFFCLNLNLLGSMVAAIATYLVILIQFMFTEKHNNEARLNTKTVQPDAKA